MNHKPLKHGEISWILLAVIEGRLPSTDMTRLPAGDKIIPPASPHTPALPHLPRMRNPARNPNKPHKFLANLLRIALLFS